MERWLDGLARSLASERSRRGAIKTLAVSASGLVLAWLGASPVEARLICRGVGQPCLRRRDCCSANCSGGVCVCGQPGDPCRTINDCCQPFGYCYGTIPRQCIIIG